MLVWLAIKDYVLFKTKFYWLFYLFKFQMLSALLVSPLKTRYSPPTHYVVNGIDSLRQATLACPGVTLTLKGTVLRLTALDLDLEKPSVGSIIGRGGLFCSHSPQNASL